MEKGPKTRDDVHAELAALRRHVTELEKQREAMRTVRDALERKISDRTSELTRINRDLKIEIEEHRQAREELQEANELLDRIFSTTHFCVAYLDCEFNLIMVNRAYAEAYGKAQNFFIGKNHFELHPSHENEALFRRVLETGETYTAFASPFDSPERPEGGAAYWDWSLHPVKDSIGEVEGLILCLVDVTDRIRAQEALLRSERELRNLSAKLLDAQENERQRLAKEIHDSISSSLAAIKFRIEETFESIETTDPAQKRALEQLVELVQDTIQEARNISSSLRPSLLEHAGLLATIRQACRKFQETYSHIRIEHHIHVEEEGIPESLKIVIYRILQEALHNVAKHAEADLVRVSFFRRRAYIILSIEDNGRGFDLKHNLDHALSTITMGLSSMRERAQLTGGDCSIISSPGKGTIVRTIWPLPDA